MYYHKKSGLVTAAIYLHPDLLGSPRKATNSSKQILWQEHYDPFGAKLNGVAEKIGYTGHAHDTETGYTYMQARFYDAAVGRFLSADPIHFTDGNPFTFNRYAYANNNPYAYTDPSGRCALKAGEYSEAVTSSCEIPVFDGLESGAANNASADGASGGISLRESGLDSFQGSMQRTAEESAMASGAVESVCPECIVLGVGRLLYAGLAKAIPGLAGAVESTPMGQAAFANAARNSLKDAFRGPLAPLTAGMRQPTFAEALAQRGFNPQAVIDAAGRTNASANAAGAVGLGLGVTCNAGDAGC